MIRNISIVLLTFALLLAQAPPKEANGHERNPVGRSLDRLSQDPVGPATLVLTQTKQAEW
jgi:hypothetical protein